MDDTLLRAPSYLKAKADPAIVGKLFQEAGFLLHGDKSLQEPTQKIKYLGFIIDSVSMCLSLPEDKVSRLRAAVKKAIRELNKQHQLTVCIAAKMIGFIVSSIPATTYGKAHYQELEFAKTRQLLAAQENFDAPFSWPEDCREDLEWWASPSNIFSTSFASLPNTTKLTTDASLEGWGALWEGKERLGAWENDHRHIDELELRAVLQALQTFPILRPGRTAHSTPL
jgi:hypothetical protein